jgi:hypothetical protein
MAGRNCPSPRRRGAKVKGVARCVAGVEIVGARTIFLSAGIPSSVATLLKTSAVVFLVSILPSPKFFELNG